MRRILRILLGLGLGLSTILLVGTGVLWVRSIGHAEGWRYDCFEPNPAWNTGPQAHWGVQRSWCIEAIQGRLWLRSGMAIHWRQVKSGSDHWREAITADEAKASFELYFTPSKLLLPDAVARTSHFAGMGFYHGWRAVHPQVGRPLEEAFTVAIPFWLLAVLFGLWPVCFTARRVLRRRRYGAGLCPQCGYDLRATPDRCPECGRAVASDKA